MKIEVLISTMNQNDYSILDKIHVQSDAIVINQCDREGKKEFQYKKYNILWINTCERGLSRSRNMAIKNSAADVCLLVDDDEELRNGYVDTLEKAFNENPSYQILRFKINGIEKIFKQYPNRSFRVGYLGSLKISSVEIAFRKKSLLKNHIEFDSSIGAGTQFLMGEENSFLLSCLRNNLKIKYIPETIADLHIGNSTWFTGFNREYFIGRGAAFTSMSKRLAPFLILQFAVRKRKRYKKDLSIYSVIQYMFQGRKKYLEIDQNNSVDN